MNESLRGLTIVIRAYRREIVASLLLIALGLACQPAVAQVDMSGQWGQKMHEDEPERGPGPEIGDYTAMPINDAARLRGDAWDAQKWEMVEHECEPHPPDYAPRGPGDMRIWSDVDPVTQGFFAWHTTSKIYVALPHDLHGRKASSLRSRASHLAGIFHGGMGRGHVEGLHRPI